LPGVPRDQAFGCFDRTEAWWLFSAAPLADEGKTIRQLGGADDMRGTPIADGVKGDYLIELARRWYRFDTINAPAERASAPPAR